MKTAPGREPVPGFDLTFSAPKSVSLTWALGGRPVAGQVAEGHHAAVAEALSGAAGVLDPPRSRRP